MCHFMYSMYHQKCHIWLDSTFWCLTCSVLPVPDPIVPFTGSYKWIPKNLLQGKPIRTLLTVDRISYKISWVINAWWHRFGLRLFEFCPNALHCWVCRKRAEKILKENLSLNPNRCHHPLITQLSWSHVWLIWLRFSHNVGMILFFIWYFNEK